MIPNKGVYRGEGSKGTALPPRPVKGGGHSPPRTQSYYTLETEE